MSYLHTATSVVETIPNVTSRSAPTTAPEQQTSECRRRNTRLYRESIELEDKLRQGLPAYALSHLAPALLGNVEEAERLVYASPNNLRAELAVLFYLRQASSVTQRAVLGGAWSKNDREVLAAAGGKARLKAMFKATKCPLPADLSERVQVWRGIHRWGLPGISWTLRRDVAVWFARRVKSLKGEPLVLSAVVPREEILFYDDSRHEAECVIFGLDYVSIHELASFDPEEGVRESGGFIEDDAERLELLKRLLEGNDPVIVPAIC